MFGVFEVQYFGVCSKTRMHTNLKTTKINFNLWIIIFKKSTIIFFIVADNIVLLNFFKKYHCFKVDF